MTVHEAQARIAEIRVKLGFGAPLATNAGDMFAAALKSTLDSSATTSSSVTGTQVVEAARKYLGTPYVFGSNRPESGLDCSGLVQRVYADLGMQLPRVAKDQALAGTPVRDLAAARPGDLLAFGSPVDHIGIYAGDGKMIVAPHTGDVVKVQQVSATPVAIRRILPAIDLDPATPTAAALNAEATVATAAMLRPAALAPLSGVPFADLFQQAGAKYGLSPTLLAAVAKVESGYNPSAVSRAGAQGLMQIMPGTARGLGVNALDPAQAVDGAARLLSSGFKQFGTLELALAAYNAGGGAVRKHGGIPPFAETQAYVPKVKAAMDQLTGKGFA